MRPLQTQEQIAEAIRENEALIWWCVSKWYINPEVSNVLDREDLFQRCCEHLLRNLDKYDTAKGKLSTYMVAICRTAMRKEYAGMAWSGTRTINGKAEQYVIEGREQTLLSAFTAEDGGGDFSADVITELQSPDMYKNVDYRMWLEALPFIERKAVTMLHLGFNFDEIAKQIDVASGQEAQMIVANALSGYIDVSELEIKPEAVVEHDLCRKGLHYMTEENTGWHKSYKRVDGSKLRAKVCKACDNERGRLYRAAKKAKKAAQEQEVQNEDFSVAPQRRWYDFITVGLQNLLHLATREYRP